MDHNTYRNNLSAYLDGELPQREKALLEAHLADCPDCARVLAELRSVSGIFKKNAMEPVPLSLKGEVLGGRRKPDAYPWFGPALAFSTVAAGVLIVMNLHKIPGNEQAFQQTGFGSAKNLAQSITSMEPRREGDAGGVMPAEQAVAPAAPEAGYYETKDKKAAASSAVAALRGAYGQSKFAAPRAFDSLSGGAAGAKAEASGRAGSLKMLSNKPQDAAEFRGPICVYVSSDRSRQEAAGGMGEEESDDFSWYLGKALIFLERSGTPSPSAEPGRLVFVKKDGSRKVVTEKDCSLCFVFFDGVQDPLVVTDFIFITDQYNKYFGTSLEPIGDEIPD